MEHGFFRSLFDLSFTSFITTKIIKLVYVVTLAIAALTAVLGVVVAFSEDVTYGVLALIGIPFVVLIYIVLARLWLEIVIQVFRITELLRDQNHLQRVAFSEAGWLSGAPARPEPVPARSPTAETASTVPACPACGAVPTPGAGFCRRCGERLA
jgi:hypothetical protein